MPSVVLNWTPAGGVVTSQKVYRGPDPGSLTLIASVSAAASTYTDTTVSSNTEYWYMIQSICSIGGPVDSDPVAVTTGTLQAVNLLVIPNSPPQQSSDNIVQSFGGASESLTQFTNPISSSWSVMGWWRADHDGQYLLQNQNEDIADTALFSIQEDYEQIANNPTGFDNAHLVIYREASSNGDYITVELLDNTLNKIRYQYLLSSGSNTAVTGIDSQYPYWDNTYTNANNNLVHLCITYTAAASIVQRVKVFWNGQELTITSVPYNAVPNGANWVNDNKRLVLGWAEGISVGYSGHTCAVSVDELVFYKQALDGSGSTVGYNNGVTEVHSNIPTLTTPDLEWSFEIDGSENNNNSAADFDLNNPPGINAYGNGPVIQPPNAPVN